MDKNLIGVVLDGQYQIDTLVGVGGMANVYKATDIKTGRTIAVKMLKEDCLANDELVRRFKNESKAISILNHPNIVKVWDVSTYESRPYIVMEYIDGITLKEYLVQRGGPLSWKEVVHFTSKILSALEHAHSKGIVHRDVKPQNIMLLADGNIKMMDFGIARFSRSQSHTISDKAIGSVHYISPEQARGDVTDATADLYSVGIMMYEMLSGRLPFVADSAVSIAIMQISDKAKPLNLIAPGVPVGLQQITEKAMAKLPQNRYPSARAMLDDIEAFKLNPNIRFVAEEAAPAIGKEPPKVPTDESRSINAGSAHRAEPAKTAAANGAAKRMVEEMPAKRRRKTKKKLDFLPIFMGMTLAFAVGAFVMCYYIFATSTNPLFSTREDLELDNFVGMTITEAKGTENASRLKFEYKEIYSNSCAAGIIYAQSPRAGRIVKAGQTVILTVSKGAHWIDVPNLQNWDANDAQEMLKENDLSVRIHYEVNEDVPVGTVFAVEPAAGTAVEEGTMVTLYVSQAKIVTERYVPSVVGLQEKDARTAISNAGLIPVVEEVPGNQEAGTVVDQSVAPNTVVRMLSRITLYVSTGLPEGTVYDGTVLVGELEGGYYHFWRESEQAFIVCRTCGHQIWEDRDGTYYCINCGSAIIW